MEAHRSSQTEATAFRGIILYVILLIALAVFIVTWLLLRKFTLIWIDRPPSFIESIISGISAWLFLISIVAWFGGVILMILDFFSSHDSLDIWMIIFSALVTGYGLDFYLRAKAGLGTRDTQDYLKEAVQFRRSGQSRLDVISLIKERRRRIQPTGGNDHESLQRARLQANLSKVKELDAQLALLREGTTIDISEIWYLQPKIHSIHPFYEKVKEVRIEPNRKRFSVIIDFPEFQEMQFKDDMVVLRFNRQVYEFFQSIYTESWLKPYAPFIESYFLICRAARIKKDNSQVFYPFMKVGINISELRKLEGFYFNPRKLSEIAAVAFNQGAQV